MAGDFSTLGGQSRSRIGRLAVQADGKIVVGGGFTLLEGQSRKNIGRLNANGSLDSTFNPSANDWVNALAVQADGKIVVGGGFTLLEGQSRRNIGRLNASGSLDATFNPGANSTVAALAVQADGKVVVGGLFTTLRGQPRNYLGRLRFDGSLEPTFNPGANGWVNALAVQMDSKIVVGGSFTMLGGQPRSRLGRLNPDGSLDLTFNPGVIGDVFALLVQADGKLVVGGNFSMLGGQPRNNIGRLNPNGSLDPTFNLGANGPIAALAVQTDGKLVVGGSFTTLGGQPRRNIGRLNLDGSLDLVFNPGANGPVLALAMQANGKLVVGGNFTTLGGQPRNFLGRLTVSGSLDPTFNPGATGLIATLAVQTDGKILVGGDFTTLGGQPRSRIGRVTNPAAALQDLQINAAGTMVTWLRSGSSPEIQRAIFERSSDGMTWTLLGVGARIAGGWRRSGVIIPRGQPVYVRARGFAASGLVHESVWLVYVPADVTTTVSGFPASAGAASTVRGVVSYSNTRGTAAGVGYALRLTAGLSGVTLTCTNGVTASYGSGTGVVTFTGTPTTLTTGQGFTCSVSYTAPGSGRVGVSSRISTTTYQGANTAPDIAGVTTTILPTLRISDVSKAEGNTGITNFVFTVTLSGTNATEVKVNYATANGGATAGSDYTTASGTLTFSPGQTSKTIPVPVAGDTVVEPNEGFLVNLSNPINATIADGQGMGLILNDDGPVLRVNDVSRGEGNSSATAFTFTVTLSPASSGPVMVHYVTANGSATATNDYTATNGTLTFNPGGLLTQQVTVNVTGDTVVEPNETFFVNLSNSSGASIFDSQGVGTVLNDDGPVLRINNVSVTEGDFGSQAATFTVTLSPASSGTVTVNYATANGSAAAGSDYTATSGKLTFAPGETSKPIPVPVRGDTVVEPNETFVVNLSGASGATIIDPDFRGVCTITNDD